MNNSRQKPEVEMNIETMLSDFPDWFRAQVDKFRRADFFQSAEAVGEFLSNSQSHIYQTYSNFNAHAKSVFLFAFGAIAVAAALVGLVPNQSDERKGMLLLAAGISLDSFIPLGLFAMRNMRERYRTYVASVIHAAYCHYAAGVPVHPWFDWLEEYLGSSKVQDVRSLTDRWIGTPPNSYLPYRAATIVLSLIFACVSIVLFIGGAVCLKGAPT